ncbi:DUF3429 domain-containing protein [Alteromonas sediminis]|uniref:DUF3429 domain-containing protein n=1 Tax=Alteromonas sediminis TaxID=2259342 RepID=A0A3N5Y199_9ALTE|nr:DUF3429 domain-containing protein [Alteromonas sediminis]RPJ67597.1 DUF3429 domain-containing protein [Alteromonas sediminis]
MKNTAWLLGVAGLLPFVGIPLLATTNTIDWYLAAKGFVSYSAVILSFLGGIHWYDAICGNRSKHQIYVAMLPSILGWLCLAFIPQLMALGLLSVGFLLIMLYDKQVLTLPKDKVVWYTKLRMTLTTVVVLSHGWMIFSLN